MQIQRFSLYKQIDLFRGTQDLIKSKIGNEAAEKFFQEARYVVALGSNDFINNYLTGVYSDSWKYNDATFIDYLMETLEDQLKVISSIKDYNHPCVIFFFLELIMFLNKRILFCTDAAWHGSTAADGFRARTDGLHSPPKGSKHKWWLSGKNQQTSRQLQCCCKQVIGQDVINTCKCQLHIWG